MKKNDIRNTNLMAALTIGITAMMSLSTPVTAYAADPNDPNATIDNTPNEPQTQQESQEQAIQVDPVTTEAHDQAEVVQETATEATDSALVKATEAAETILMGNEEAGIEAATAGEAGTISDKAIDALIEAAQDITVDDKDEEGNITDASAVTHLENATEAIETVKAELQAAETANYNAEVTAQTIDDEADVAFENASAAIEVTENIEKDVQDAQKKADELIDAIKEAENEEAAQALYDELTEAVTNAETSVADKKAYYLRLMENYDKAVAELRRAEEALETFEKAYSKNVDDAYSKAQEAEQDIEEAQTKVNNLADALETVEQKLVQEANDADEVSDAFAAVTKADWDLQRNAAMSVVENYIIPQLEGKDISNVQWEVIKGFDRQDYNYSKITYTENGNEVTRYFNIDRLNKEASDDRYAKIGSSYGIAVYEKTEEELAAEAFLIEQYGNEAYYAKTHIPGKPNSYDGNQYKKLQEKANAGDLDVFKYTNEDGERVLLTREMLNAALESGDIIDDNGEMKTKDGQVVQEIVQNQNNLLHDGNAFLVANEVDVTTTKKYKNQIINALNNSNGSEEAAAKYDAMVDANHTYNTYIAATKSVVNEDGENEHHLSAKYNSYDEVVLEAQKAVDGAKEEAEKLTEAIDELKENKKNRTILAVDALGVTDIAGYLGIEVTAERATELNNMTVSQAITALDGYLEDAGKKVETAESNLETVKGAPAIALQELNTVLTKLNPRSTNPVVPPSTGGGDGSGTTIDTEPDPEGEGLAGGGTNPTIIPDEEVPGSDTPEGGTGTGEGVNQDNVVPSGDAPLSGGGNGQGVNVEPEPDVQAPTTPTGGGTGQSVTPDNVAPADGGTGQGVNTEPTPETVTPGQGGTGSSDNVAPASDTPVDGSAGQSVNTEPTPETVTPGQSGAGSSDNITPPSDTPEDGSGTGQGVNTEPTPESVTPGQGGTGSSDNVAPASDTPVDGGAGQSVNTEPTPETITPGQSGTGSSDNVAPASNTPADGGSVQTNIADDVVPTSDTPVDGTGSGQSVDTESTSETVTPAQEGTSQTDRADNVAPTSDAPTDGGSGQSIDTEPAPETVTPAQGGTIQTNIADNVTPTSDTPAGKTGTTQTVDTEPGAVAPAASAAQTDGVAVQADIPDEAAPTSADAGVTTHSTTAETVASLQSQAAPQTQPSLSETLTQTTPAEEQSQSLSETLQTSEGADTSVVTGTDTAGTTTTIPDEGVAGSDTPSGTQKTTTGQDKEVTSITDDKVALANVAEVDFGDVENLPVTKDKMNWWWLLIILLLGEKGRRMYEKYKEEHEIKDGPQN